VGTTSAGIAISMRTIPDRIPRCSEIGVDEELREAMMSPYGMKIMVGPTGSGKTTTLAAIVVEHMLANPAPKIITHEEPIEFAYALEGLGQGPLICQSEIFTHMRDWRLAGPNAMRRKADHILMGEVRDADSAEYTMEMAMTGHGAR
jgi:twitching motility protein PilU